MASEPPRTTQAHAVLVAERINLRQITPQAPVALHPPMTEVPGGGTAVLFRFGVVVFFNVTPSGRSTFINRLSPQVEQPLDPAAFEAEGLEIRADPQHGDTFESGILLVKDDDPGSLQVIADVLAKSVLLASYEARISATFDRVEPLAEKLQRHGRGVRQARGLVRHIGETLRVQHRMVGRAQVGDKPEIIWEHPELERLFVRLETEYELRERLAALDRKLEVISVTAETLLDLLHSQRSLRVEWYIVILIVIEIVLSLYEMFFRHA